MSLWVWSGGLPGRRLEGGGNGDDTSAAGMPQSLEAAFVAPEITSHDAHLLVARCARMTLSLHLCSASRDFAGSVQWTGHLYPGEGSGWKNEGG